MRPNSDPVGSAGERAVIPLADAACRLGVTAEAARQAIRRRDLEGYLAAAGQRGRWFVYTDSLSGYVPRKRRGHSLAGSIPADAERIAALVDENVSLRETTLQLIAAAEEDRLRRAHQVKAAQYAAMALTELVQADQAGSRAHSQLEAALSQWVLPGSPAGLDADT